MPGPQKRMEHHYCIGFDADLWQALDAYLVGKDLTKALVIRMAIREYLAKQKARDRRTEGEAA